VRLILASASPRRAELLRAAGYEFDVAAVEIDESVQTGERAEDYVRRLAMEKSAVVSGFPGLGAVVGSRTSSGPPEGGSYEGHMILAADTAVVVDGEILGKPADAVDSRRMLGLLSGREHRVLTGLSLRSGSLELGGVESTSVWFSPLSRQDIDWYVASGEGRDKAGAYAIQGLASRLIPRIDGSYSNVVGLPVHRVARLMTEMGYVPDLGKRA
jgi:septum formation protein